MRRKRYQNGGPITPNYQTLGDIKFDSNKIKRKNGVLVATDETTKKDYGVVREASGVYRFYNDKVDKPMDDTAQIRQYYKNWIDSDVYNKMNAGVFEEDVAAAKQGEKTQVATTPVRFQSLKEHPGSHYNPLTNLVYIDPADEKEFGRKAVIAHELNHAREMGPNKAGVPYLGVGYQKNYNYKKGSATEYMASTRDIIENTGGTHDAYPNEYRSDINAARFLLFDKSIYDPINQPFTKEHLETLKKDKELNKTHLIKRLLENSKDEEGFIRAMNELAQNSSKSSTQNVATGGHLQNNQMRKRKNCATGGGLDPWTLLASQGTQMIGDFGSAINYKPQLGPEKSQGDYNKDIITKGIMQGPLGAIPSIIRMMKDKNTIVSGSPGTYQQGGPMQPLPVIQRPLQQNIVRTRPIQQNTDILNSFNPFYTPTATGVPTLSAVNMFDYGHPSKSKSKDRFRERATGGSLDDQQLSSNAFQVKGNANQTDGNHYPEYNANLDHNEVVDQNAKFVFSDDLNIPGTKRSFAQAAKPLYKKVGDLETRKDPISAATKTQLNNQINSLAMSQEQLATMMGLRDEQSANVANGGPLPWEGFDVAEFQAWYNSMPGGSKVGMDGKWGPATKKAYEAVAFDYMKAKGKNTVNSIGSMSTVLPDGSNYVDVQPTDGKLLPSSIGEPQKLPQIYDTANLPNRSGYSFKPTRTADGSMITSLDTNDMLATLIPNNGVDPILAPQASDIAGGMKALGTKYSPANIANSRNDFNQGFTAGDIMQGIEVGSKFFNVFEGAEQEGQILNNTPITKTGYDVNPALYQNQRNYRNTLNGIGTASAPQRRALSNQLLATKLNADNQVLSNYQNMNNEATVNYENRLSQQRQGNIASEFRTDDLNAANRGLYDQAQQNAFTSVGNFGEALNRRKMSQDALQLLRINYPDIYESVMGDLNTVKKRTSTQVKIG